MMDVLKHLGERLANFTSTGNPWLEEIYRLTNQGFLYDEAVVIIERSQPKLNKYDPGSLLGWCVHLLQKEGLGDAADEVKEVSRHISKAWQGRER